IKHCTGIPHSPIGQAIVECAHHTLKQLLNKQKSGESGWAPAERLAKALYVLNYLRLAVDRDKPPMTVHSSALCSGITRDSNIVLVQYKDLKTGEWMGP
ncbi:IGEB protein, partial [Serilophus lunatus]|nr:IGEB protein [Serilophus lunatus]